MVKSKWEVSLCKAWDNKWKKPIFELLKCWKEPVMKQFNSTSGKTVILPLYSTVELEDRISSTKKTNSDEINLLTDYCSLIHKSAQVQTH